jgi:hypothetical protein
VKSWTYTAKNDAQNTTFWLQDLLPNPFPDARIMTYGYKADGTSISGARDHARHLLARLRDHRDEDEVGKDSCLVRLSVGSRLIQGGWFACSL